MATSSQVSFLLNLEPCSAEHVAWGITLYHIPREQVMQRNKCPRTPDVMKAGLNRLFYGLVFLYLFEYILFASADQKQTGRYV